MGFVVLDPLEAQRPAGFFVDDHFDLREIEIERTLRESASPQNGREVPGGVETARELVVCRLLHDRVSLLVSETAGALDDSASETCAPRGAVFSEADEDGMRQPIDIRVEAANAVTQPLGQHRDDAVD